jgi:hypothetical protein
MVVGNEAPTADNTRYPESTDSDGEESPDAGFRSPEGRMLLSKTEGLDITIPSAEYTAFERSKRRTTHRKKHSNIVGHASRTNSASGLLRNDSSTGPARSALTEFTERRRPNKMTSDSNISLSKKGKQKRSRGKKKKMTLKQNNKTSSSDDDGHGDYGDHGDYAVDTDVPVTITPSVDAAKVKGQSNIKEETEKVLRKFNDAPASKPKRIIFDHPGTDLTYIDVKRAIEKVIPDAFTENKVILIQFENRNIKLNTEGLDNRWHIEMSNFPTRNQLLKSGLSFRYRCHQDDGTFVLATRHCKLKLYDLVTTEEYKKFLRSIADKDKLQTFILSTTGRIKSKSYS